MHISFTVYVSVLLFIVTGLLLRRSPVSMPLFPAASALIFLAIFFQNAVPDAGNFVLSAGFIFLLLRFYDASADIYTERKNMAGKANYRELIKNNRRSFFLQVFLFPLSLNGPVVLADRFQITEKSILSLSSEYTRGMYYVIIGLIKIFFFLPFLTQNFETSLLLPPSLDQAGMINIVHTGLFRYLFYFLEFSSAADLAVGFCGLLGMKIEHNFHYPYFSHTLSEFWNRWSMTVSSWLNKHIFTNNLFSYNSKISFFLLPIAVSSLQGASFNFAIFGLLHGTALLLEKKFLPEFNKDSSFSVKIFRFVLTQGFITLSWAVI